MIGSLLLLGLLTFGLAFLIADASIFGVSSKAYFETISEAEELNEGELLVESHIKYLEVEDMLTSNGILRIRNRLLQKRFFGELLSCYFCLGVWCGMTAHALLVGLSRTFAADQVPYALAHGNSVSAWLGGLLVGGVVGAPLCYGIDLIYTRLEAHG